MQTYSSTVTSKGTITLPANFRQKAHIRAGSKVTIVMKGNSFIVKPLGTWDDFANVRAEIFENNPTSKPVTDGQIEKAKVEFYENKLGLK